jgi:hypothetical protein
MKRNDKDILTAPELREMPFTVPEGYFKTFKSNVTFPDSCIEHPKKMKVGRYIAIAASFALLAGIGWRITSDTVKQDQAGDIDLMVLSEMSIENYYDFLASHEEDELTNEDIIEYLLDSVGDISDINPNE